MKPKVNEKIRDRIIELVADYFGYTASDWIADEKKPRKDTCECGQEAMLACTLCESPMCVICYFDRGSWCDTCRTAYVDKQREVPPRGDVSDSDTLLHLLGILFRRLWHSKEGGKP